MSTADDIARLQAAADALRNSSDRLEAALASWLDYDRRLATAPYRTVSAPALAVADIILSPRTKEAP